MASFNKVILAGNLARDPEMRYTPQGKAVTRISLAVSRAWTTETGEKREEVSFIEVEAWGRQAETLSKYMRKGRPLLVEGRLKQDVWEDKNSHQKQYKLKVVLEGFSFIDSRPAEGGPPKPVEQGAAAAAAAPAVAEASAPSDADAPPPEEDDVPF